jgi:hypothetical protein
MARAGQNKRAPARVVWDRTAYFIPPEIVQIVSRLVPPGRDRKVVANDQGGMNPLPCRCVQRAKVIKDARVKAGEWGADRPQLA